MVVPFANRIPVTPPDPWAMAAMTINIDGDGPSCSTMMRVAGCSYLASASIASRAAAVAAHKRVVLLLAYASTASSAAAVLLCAITGNVQAPMRLGVRSAASLSCAAAAAKASTS